MAPRGAMQSAFREVREKIADVNAQIENSISGNRVVQAFTNEEYEIGKFHESNTRFMTGLGFLTNFLNVAVVGYGGYLIYAGIISVGDLVAFVLYIGLILQPIRRLTNFTQQFEQGMSGFRRFVEIMDETPDVGDRTEATELSHVLRHVDLEVPPAKTVALVGPSGAGKTTHCNLIPRFYDVDDGKITIDGVGIRDVTLNSLRKAIGIVQQDVFLLTGAVKENILYGDVGATDSQVVEAARRANIHDSHDELIAAGGLYRELYNAQFKGYVAG